MSEMSIRNVYTKCLYEMSYTKCLIRNVLYEMSYTKCLIRNVLYEMSYTKCLYLIEKSIYNRNVYLIEKYSQLYRHLTMYIVNCIAI